MKIELLTLALLISVSATQAQWSAGSTSDPTHRTGNVGIGTTSPGAKISFTNIDETTAADGITWYNSSPTSYGIYRTAGSWTSPNYQQLKLQWPTGITFDPGNAYAKSYVEIMGGGLRVTSGNVGIGVTNPEFRLSVAGSVSAGNAYLDTPAEAENNYTRSNFGSNVYWDAVANVWTAKNIGNNDFSAIVHPNADGLAFITAPSEGASVKTMGHSAFMAYERMRIGADGNIGVGTNCPGYKFEVHSAGSGTVRVVSAGASTNSPALDILDNTHGSEFVISPSAGRVDLFTYSGHPLAFGTNNSEKMRILTNGNVGIGTANPDHKLTVNGTLHVKEVLVDLSIPAPDYVFEKDYDLLSLSEIESYIKANKHLPEVPSAKEMEANGLNLKEMNLLLLKKVEELTLHLIEMKKQHDNQQDQLREQGSRIKALNEKIYEKK